jgi:hypothetical protein
MSDGSCRITCCFHPSFDAVSAYLAAFHRYEGDRVRRCTGSTRIRVVPNSWYIIKSGPFVVKEWVEAISKGRWKQSQHGTILQDPTVGREKCGLFTCSVSRCRSLHVGNYLRRLGTPHLSHRHIHHLSFSSPGSVK